MNVVSERVSLRGTENGERAGLPVLQVGLLFLLLVASGFESFVNFQTQTQWGTSLFRVTAAALGLALVLDHGTAKRGWRPKTLFFFGVALLLGLLFVYDFNASHTWVAGVGLVPRPHRSFLPASVFTGARDGVFWSLVAGVGVLGTGCRLRARPVAVLLAFCVLLVLGITVWALGQRLTPRPFAVYEWTGNFVSHNHFAAFACLFFPVLCTLGIALQADARDRGRLSSPAPLLYLVAGLLCWAVLLTGSRAGIGILLLQWLGLLGCLLAVKKGMPVFRFIVGLGVLGGVGIALIAMRGGLLGIGRDVWFRGRIIMDVSRMIGERPWWGMGPGTFAVVFPYYQSEGLAGHFFRHAHNEPVQILAEWGGLGVGVLLAGLWLIRAATAPAGRGSPDAAFGPGLWVGGRWLQTGLLLALGGVFIHSLVDFPFRHPLLLLTAALWLSLLGTARGRTPQEEGPGHGSTHPPSSSFPDG